LLRDFTEEVDLYCQAGSLINFLKNWKSDKADLASRFLDLVREMINQGFYQAKDLDLAQAWIDDLKMVGWQQPSVKGCYDAKLN
jgi:hypothetical protein